MPQSLAQARDRWGEQAAAAIWEAATTKLLLGGESSPRDLHDLSQLIGERDERTVSTTRAAPAAAGAPPPPSAGCRSCPPTS